MNRILAIIITTLAITTGMWLAPGVVRANAASCSVAPPGGEKVPAIDNTGGTVSETGEQGYKCTVQWDSVLFAQYESGGTWHDCVVNTSGGQCPPAFHPNTPDQFWPANSYFEWPIQNQHLSDALWTWTVAPGPAPDFPVCSVNWKILISFFGTNGVNFQSDSSPTLHKTC